MNETILSIQKLNVKYQEPFKADMQWLIYQTTMRKVHQKKQNRARTYVWLTLIRYSWTKSEKGNELQLPNGAIYFLLDRCINPVSCFTYFSPRCIQCMYFLIFSVVFVDQYHKVLYFADQQTFRGMMSHKSIQIVLNEHENMTEHETW